MISSLPNKLVVGEPFLDGYKKSKSFYFCIHEIKHFFVALCKCIMYITFEKPESFGVILERSGSEKYIWEGVEVIHYNSEGDQQMERKFYFKKKKNDTVTYKIEFSFHQTEMLITIINDLILTSMCLKISDRIAIENLIEKKLINGSETKDKLTSILKHQNFYPNNASIVDLLFFYKDIFYILSETLNYKQKLLHPQFFIDQIENLSTEQASA